MAARADPAASNGQATAFCAWPPCSKSFSPKTSSHRYCCRSHSSLAESARRRSVRAKKQSAQPEADEPEAASEPAPPDEGLLAGAQDCSGIEELGPAAQRIFDDIPHLPAADIERLAVASGYLRAAAHARCQASAALST